MSNGYSDASAATMVQSGLFWDPKTNQWQLNQSSMYTDMYGNLNAAGIGTAAIGGINAAAGIANVGVGIANAIDSAKNNKLYRESLQQQIEYNKENQEYLRSERNRLNTIRSNTQTQFSSGTATKTSY